MHILPYLQQHLPPFALDLLRLTVWLALLAAIFLPLEWLSGAGGRRHPRQSWLTDLGYYFLNGLCARTLLAVPSAWLALALAYAIPDAVRAWGGGLPLPARLAATMLVGEIGYYWGHRWMHEIPWLWRFHAIHHSAVRVDWLVSTRAHPLDIVFPRLCGFVPMYALGLVQPRGNTADWLLLAIFLIGYTWGFFIHANLNWRLGWLEYLVSTPAFHHWHHTNDSPAVINKNYAPMLPWIDLLFGTFHLPKRQLPARYGINDPLAPDLPRQLLQPFVPAWQPWRRAD